MSTDLRVSPESIMVGSVASSTQHVTMPGIDTTTRSKALRAPCWVLVLVVQLVASGGYWGGILDALIPG
jgi:hypothetical protein